MENYSRRFIITYPNEELPAARPRKTTALYDRLKARGAVLGVNFALEHALWFAPSPAEAKEKPSFRRSNAFPYVAEEVRAVREAVGVIEIANYAKHEVSGPGAAEYLDRIFANRLPEVGRLLLSPILTPKGKLYGDLTLGRLEPGPLRHLRLRGGAEHAPALVREPSAGGRRQLSQPDRRAARARHCRAEVARAAVAA